MSHGNEQDLYRHDGTGGGRDLRLYGHDGTDIDNFADSRLPGGDRMSPSRSRSYRLPDGTQVIENEFMCQCMKHAGMRSGGYDPRQNPGYLQDLYRDPAMLDNVNYSPTMEGMRQEEYWRRVRGDTGQRDRYQDMIIQEQEMRIRELEMQVAQLWRMMGRGQARFPMDERYDPGVWYPEHPPVRTYPRPYPHQTYPYPFPDDADVATPGGVRMPRDPRPRVSNRDIIIDESGAMGRGGITSDEAMEWARLGVFAWLGYETIKRGNDRRGGHRPNDRYDYGTHRSYPHRSPAYWHIPA